MSSFLEEANVRRNIVDKSERNQKFSLVKITCKPLNAKTVNVIKNIRPHLLMVVV